MKNRTPIFVAVMLAATAAFAQTPLENLSGWLDAANSASEIKKVSTRSVRSDKMRVIAEVKTPTNAAEEANQYAELAFFKSNGYNSALLVWDSGDSSKLGEISKNLKAQGWTLGFAYGVKEDGVGSTPYSVSFNSVKSAVANVIPQCDFFLVTWRGSSIHQKNVQDGGIAPYVAAICAEVRRSNPAVSVYSEMYLEKGCKNAFAIDVPNADGFFVVNGASASIDAKRLSGLLPTGNNYIVVVVGAIPYYNSIFKVLDAKPEVIYRGKIMVENSFLSSPGFNGTITLVGDGMGDREWAGVQCSDSLTKSEWRTLKKLPVQ